MTDLDSSGGEPIAYHILLAGLVVLSVPCDPPESPGFVILRWATEHAVASVIHLLDVEPQIGEVASEVVERVAIGDEW